MHEEEEIYHMQSPGWQPTLCDLMSDLVICKFIQSMVIHDTECPYWDQVSYNTNPYMQSSVHFMCDLMSDLVICKFRKLFSHDTTCPYWDQVLLNNTNQTKPNIYIPTQSTEED